MPTYSVKNSYHETKILLVSPEEYTVEKLTDSSLNFQQPTSRIKANINRTKGYCSVDAVYSDVRGVHSVSFSQTIEFKYFPKKEIISVFLPDPEELFDVVEANVNLNYKNINLRLSRYQSLDGLKYSAYYTTELQSETILKKVDSLLGANFARALIEICVFTPYSKSKLASAQSGDSLTQLKAIYNVNKLKQFTKSRLIRISTCV